jgi:hypothetical protein
MKEVKKEQSNFVNSSGVQSQNNSKEEIKMTTENEQKEEIKMTKEEVLANLKQKASEQGGTNFLKFKEGEQRILYIVGEETERFLSPVWIVKDLDTKESFYLSQYGYLKSRVEVGKAYYIEYQGTSEIKQGKFKGKTAHLFRVMELTKADLTAFGTEDIPF